VRAYSCCVHGRGTCCWSVYSSLCSRRCEPPSLTFLLSLTHLPIHPFQRGQLGHGTLDTVAAPTVIHSLAASGVVVVDISAGGFHSALLTSSGGEFAVGVRVLKSNAILVPDEVCPSFVCTPYPTLLDILTCGGARYGQLGHAADDSAADDHCASPRPVDFPPGTLAPGDSWVTVSCGGNHSGCLSSACTLLCVVFRRPPPTHTRSIAPVVVVGILFCRLQTAHPRGNGLGLSLSWATVCIATAASSICHCPCRRLQEAVPCTLGDAETVGR
jgi:hypothetical protein